MWTAIVDGRKVQRVALSPTCSRRAIAEQDEHR
jgi:hypothetical protein